MAVAGGERLLVLSMPAVVSGQAWTCSRVKSPQRGEGAMEVPATGGIGSAGAASLPQQLTPKGDAELTTLQASASTQVDLAGGPYEALSLSVQNSVEMFYAQISQGGLDEQTLRAVILLLVLQLLLKGGFDEQTSEALKGLIDAFQQAGNTEMTLVAVKASSLVEIDLGGSEQVQADDASQQGGLDLIV